MGKLKIMDCGYGRLPELGGRGLDGSMIRGIVMLWECL